MNLGTGLLALFLATGAVRADMRVVALPGRSPLIDFRIVFLTGAAQDPADKAGLANLTASLLSQGGTRELTYKQIVDAMFPMAAGVSAQTDKEMIAFYGSTHADNLEKYYSLLRAVLLDPGWREDDLRRV